MASWIGKGHAGSRNRPRTRFRCLAWTTKTIAGLQSMTFECAMWICAPNASILLPALRETRIANPEWARRHIRNNLPSIYAQCLRGHGRVMRRSP